MNNEQKPSQEEASDKVEDFLVGKFGAKFWEKLSVSILAFLAVWVFTNTVLNLIGNSKRDVQIGEAKEAAAKRDLTIIELTKSVRQLTNETKQLKERNSDIKTQWQLLSKYNFKMQQLEVQSEVNQELIKFFSTSWVKHRPLTKAIPDTAEIVVPEYPKKEPGLSKLFPIPDDKTNQGPEAIFRKMDQMKPIPQETEKFREEQMRMQQSRETFAK